MSKRLLVGLLVASAGSALVAQQLGPRNEPAAMGSSYQPLLWWGDDAQFALDTARASKCQIEADTLVGSRSSDTDLQELAAHSLGLQDRLGRKLEGMARTIGFKLGSKKHPPECADKERLAPLSGEAFDRAYLSILGKTNESERTRMATEAEALVNSANYELKKLATYQLALFNEQQVKLAELKKRYAR